jgi:hypothetical protein
MERRIKSGSFAFPDREWRNVSDEAKLLINGMLETSPEKRFKIEDVMNSQWIRVSSFFLNIIIQYFVA